MATDPLLDAELESLIHAVSHDLGEPLRSLEGFSVALLEDYGDALDEDGQLYIGRIRAATARLGARIDALLKLSRHTRGELALAPVDLGLLAQQATPPALTLRCQGDLTAHGDARLLRHLLDELLGNCAKFEAKSAALARDAEGAFTLIDDGVGFDPTYAERIFVAFGRYHGPDEYPGQGVGLTIARRIVHRHGGTIAATSPGTGCTVRFTLPR
ncbi:MAG: hypothetical protein KC613_00410 [Myxococcales bacterium]|nr:hypothetical protein [Myxococcales bacterium]MCB9525877.1 hypothetical protein [Myxococcales bacterium]